MDARPARMAAPNHEYPLVIDVDLEGARMPHTNADLLDTVLLSLEADIGFEENRLHQALALVDRLSRPDKNEQETFALLRNLITQSRASTAQSQQLIESAKAAVAQIRHHLEKASAPASGS